MLGRPRAGEGAQQGGRLQHLPHAEPELSYQDALDPGSARRATPRPREQLQGRPRCCSAQGMHGAPGDREAAGRRGEGFLKQAVPQESRTTGTCSALSPGEVSGIWSPKNVQQQRGKGSEARRELPRPVVWPKPPWEGQGPVKELR